MNDNRWFNTETSNAILQGSRMNWGFAEFVRLELLHTRYKSKKCGPTPPIIVHLPEYDPDFTTRGWLQGADAAKKRQLPETALQPANLLTKGGVICQQKTPPPRIREGGGVAAAARNPTDRCTRPQPDHRSRATLAAAAPAASHRQQHPAAAAAAAKTRYAPQPRSAAY